MFFFLVLSMCFILSSLVFLFSINNVLGLEFFKIDVKEDNLMFVVFNDFFKGLVFGLDDLIIVYNDSRIL